MDLTPSAARFAILVALALGCEDDGRSVDAPEPLDYERLDTIARSTDEPGADPVVLVTIDGVRWSEIFTGAEPARVKGAVLPAAALAPNLHRLATERGAFVGAPERGTIVASGPNYVSLPGYIEIFTGRPPVACRDNECPRVQLPTIFDEANARGREVAVFASWAPIARAATAHPGAFPVSCGRAPEDGALDPFPGRGDYRPDRVTAARALDYIANATPDLALVALGDPDEHAHRGDYAGYLAALRHADDVIGRLLAILDAAGERGRRTHVFVTTDHGRAADFADHGRAPESARVWLAAAGPRLPARGTIATGAHRLSDVAPTIRRILALPPDPSTRAGIPIDALFAAAGGDVRASLH